ncbi:MAG: OmpP1/FadL family transporter [bacterium]
MPNSTSAIVLRKLCLRTLVFFLPLILLSSRSATGQAQRPLEPQVPLMQLRLTPINAAARPASMGGAFIGVADDATAAAINPAGLSFLLRPEISLSQAGGWYTRELTAGKTEEIDETRSQAEFIFDQTLVNIVYPQWGFTFALFRQVVSRSESDLSRQQFLTIAPARRLTLREALGASGNFPGVHSEFSSEVIHNGLVIAKALRRRYRLGFSLRNTQLKIQLHERHYFDPRLWLQSNLKEGTFAIGANRIEGLYRLYDLSANELKLSWELGILMELHPNLTLGAVYQNQPAYELQARITLPAYSLPDSTPNDSRNDEIRFVPREEIVPFTLNLPDHLGIGLGWKANPKTLLAADAVLYFTRSLFQGLEMNLPQDDMFTSKGNYTDTDGRSDFETRNVLSFHAGIEHTFIERKIIVPMRLGFYTEPNFGLRPISSDGNLQREYPEIATKPHVTGGFGIIFKHVRFEGSVDYSSALFEAIGTAVVSF